MSAELIYKTRSGSAIEWYRRGQEMLTRQQQLRQDFETEILETFGPSKSLRASERPQRGLWNTEDAVIGIDSGYSEHPPADSGLRLDSKERFWKPALRSPKGREWRDRLASLTIYAPRRHFPEVGIPQMVFAGSTMYRGGLDFDEEPEPTLYQIWGSGRCAEECLAAQAKVPEIEWTEVLRSAWYAREEAKAVSA